ncbi:minor capsid protein [Litorihabitans aurantiacus]|uniref:Uncharacterized protein n=1 Tax=Litorihabitans aurantiacus TaxID=1930061 RepID=A0AA37XH21_9MICO|nr:minor capsid protein [Litorihabitans aurantiacus]GMA33508.1 hypothetical protein GCM10025875_35000 [Litorihabitans aurantiacus]GMA33587.1 hypothetical protein GCM10025875_35790 [Litorihabitans aurantiacus]
MDDSQLTQAICRLLAEIPGWEWRPAGPAYTTVEVGVQYGSLQASPDRGVAVRVYSSVDELQTGLATRSAQLRFRGARNAVDSADKLASVAFRHLQGLSRREGISGIRRLSMAPIGADANGREERTDNYELLLELTPEVSP